MANVEPINLLTINLPRGDTRETERFSCYRIKSGLGNVVDISITGVSIQHSGRSRLSVGDLMNVSLAYGKEQSITVSCQIMWVKHVGFMRHTSGLRFDGVNEVVRQQINKMLACRSAS